MELMALQCPQCGGTVKQRKSENAYICEHCGMAFIVTMNNHDEYEKNIKLADSAYEKDRFKEAKHYYRMALEADPKDWKADLMIAACDLRMSTWRHYYGSRFKKTVSDTLIRINGLPAEQQRGAKEKLAETIHECAVFCNNRLVHDVLAAEESYEGGDRFHDLDYVHVY